MPSVNTIYDNLAPAHILIFGTSFGAQLYQSFISGPVSYSALPRQHFSHLQSKTFPIYFTLQTLSAPLLLLTLPRRASESLITLCTPSSNPNFNISIVPIAVAFVTSAANLLFVGPATTKLMEERRRVIEGIAAGEGGEVGKTEGSQKLAELNKSFGTAHGASTMLNLVGLIAVGVVGWGVGKRVL